MSLVEISADRSDLKLRSAFYRSMTLLVSIAAIILAGGEGALLPSGLTPLFAVAGWLLVDHQRWLRIPVWIGNVLALTALGFAVNEFRTGGVLEKLFAGSHLIVYLTWVILLMPKGNRQYWWLIALTVLHLAIAGVLSIGAGFGAALIGMMLLLLWTMSVFSLYRVQDRHAGHAASRSEAGPIRIRNGLQRDPAATWIGWRFRGTVLASGFVSLILAGFVFAAFPRVWVPGGSLFGSARSVSRGMNRMTGAADSVELGSIGQMMVGNQRVLTFSITDAANDRPVTVEAFEDAMQMDEIRFRGNAHGVYNNGRWTRGHFDEGRPNNDHETSGFSNAVKFDPAFRVDIAQDPPFTGLAFAPYPVTRAISNAPLRVHQRPQSGTLVWVPIPDSAQTTPLGFVVECPRLDRAPGVTFEYWAIRDDVNAEVRAQMQAGNRYFAAQRYITRRIEDRLPQLNDLARELCTENGALVEEGECVRRILRYLERENGFQYSLRVDRQDRSLDPVEDFLLNTKTGHCEYFASACALMLQSVGVPSRLISGYYGSEINSVTGRYEVRQRHAHAWVESYLDHRWQTLEPTPSSERRESVTGARPPSLLSDFQLAFTDLWNNGVHRMSAERQQEFFAPVISSAKSLIDTIRQQGILTTIQDFFRTFVTSPEVWFSWQGGLVTFALLLILLGLYRLKVHARLIAALRAIRRRYSAEHRSAQSVIRFYAGFCSLCERHGLRFSESGSALENCDAALHEFGAHWEAAQLQDVPRRIALAFNDVRFGGQTLPDDFAAGLGRDLQQLAEALRLPVPSERSQS